MKAFHFELTTGERGTLAGCDERMTAQEALELLNYQFAGRLEAFREVPNSPGMTESLIAHRLEQLPDRDKPWKSAEPGQKLVIHRLSTGKG